MPSTPHIEKHFTAGLFVRDVVIGMADGLTVPFALAAGLSGAVSSTRLIVIGGVAEIAAGSIAMGLGGYLAAKGDAEHYDQEKLREEREIVEIPDAEKAEVEELFEQYGLTEAEAKPVVEALSHRPKEWVDFMMRFELGLEEPDPKRAVTSAATIALSYVAGGIHSAVALHHSGECVARVAVVGGGYAGGAGGVRVHEGAFYGHRTPARRVTDNGDRWPCGGSRFCDCEDDLLSL